MGSLTRRQVLRGGLGAGGMLLARPIGALAQPLGPATDAYGTSRASRLDRTRLLVHADMHNHTLFSDGDGHAADAFASMRSYGLDVAALTDHSTVSDGVPASTSSSAAAFSKARFLLDAGSLTLTREVSMRPGGSMV